MYNLEEGPQPGEEVNLLWKHTRGTTVCGREPTGCCLCLSPCPSVLHDMWVLPQCLSFLKAEVVFAMRCAVEDLQGNAFLFLKVSFFRLLKAKSLASSFFFRFRCFFRFLLCLLLGHRVPVILCTSLTQSSVGIVAMCFKRLLDSASLHGRSVCRTISAVMSCSCRQ